MLELDLRPAQSRSKRFPRALPGADIGLDLRSEKTIQSDKKQFILVRNGSFKYEPIQSHTNQLGPTPYGSVPHKTLQSNMKNLG